MKPVLSGVAIPDSNSLIAYENIASIMPLKGICFVVYFRENMPLSSEKIHFENNDFLPKIDYRYFH